MILCVDVDGGSIKKIWNTKQLLNRPLFHHRTLNTGKKNEIEIMKRKKNKFLSKQNEIKHFDHT
jgi:hypothetical protein